MADDDERLAALEELTTEQAHELMAMELLLRALIVSHPNPATLKEELERLSVDFSDRLREHAFDTDRSPHTAQAVLRSVEPHVNRWLQILGGAQPTAER